MQEAVQTPEQAFVPVKTELHHSVAAPLNTVQSADLLQGGKSVVIAHNGALYRLQTTKLGKLILTK